MVEVLIWNFSAKGLKGKGNIGHAALKTSHDYVSWWPSRPVSVTKGRVPARPHDEATDIMAEGAPPDHRIEIRGLDEAAISYWWTSFQTSRDYRLFMQNCSTVVALAMKEGGATKLCRGAGWAWHSWNTIWHPNDVRRYALAAAAGGGKP